MSAATTPYRLLKSDRTDCCDDQHCLGDAGRICRETLRSDPPMVGGEPRGVSSHTDTLPRCFDRWGHRRARFHARTALNRPSTCSTRGFDASLILRPVSTRTPTVGLRIDLPMAKARFIDQMLLLRKDRLPEGNEWEYQLKLDGYRAIAFKTAGKFTCALATTTTLVSAIRPSSTGSRNCPMNRHRWRNRGAR